MMQEYIVNATDAIVNNKDLIITIALVLSLIFAKATTAIAKVHKEVIDDFQAKNEKWTDQEKLDQAIDYFQTILGARIPLINLPVFDQVIHFIVQKTYDAIKPKN